ncbi:MAG: hypothetical protein U0174_26540 [Polyangiaceae bacterium]
MSALARGGASFRAREIVGAAVVAAAAQLSIAGVFLLPPPDPVEADVSDENAHPIAVAITPVPLLRLGSKTPAKLPSRWERSKPAEKAPGGGAPDKSGEHAQPSTNANSTNNRSLDAGMALATNDASSGPSTSPDPATSASSGSGAPASTVLGAPEGVASGTEADPLKARAADMYRAQLAAWFASRFAIRGKVPFETLKTLSASAIVTIGPERHVTGFSITKTSGNATFDDEVRTTLQSIQSSGVEVPAPPPLYPEMLGKSLPVSFRCTNPGQCS